MKRYNYILCAVLMVVFASCSKSEIGDETPQSNQVTLKVTADEGLQTRGDVTGVDHFAIEVYTDATYTTEANVFSGGTNKSNNATGVFTMVLDRTQAYYCLLWADKSGSSVYDITSLKAVTLTGNAVEAWHGTKSIAAGATVALDASLTRAVSKISLIETGKLKLGSTLKLNFNQPTMFNVADATTSTSVTRTEESISIATDMDGTVAPVKLNSTDIFVLSSVATADLTDLTFKFNEEADFTVSQAPLKANFNTNINGHYTSAKEAAFKVTADDAWGGSNNEVNFPQAMVGDFYMINGTRLPGATVLTTVQQEDCIGIVFWVDPTNPQKGKIVGLTEATDKAWGPVALALVEGNSTTDGATATKNLINKYKDEANFAANYPAFEWVYMTVNGGDIDGRWYIPAKDELKALYGKHDADLVVDASVKTVVNASLNKVSDSAQLLGYYWSTTQYQNDDAWTVWFLHGYPANNKKDKKNSVRVVSAFW